MTPGRSVLLAFAMLSGLLCVGCAGEPPVMSSTEANRAAQQGYLLGSGDNLRITVFGEEKLTGPYSVSAAGTVAFPLVGTIPAQGHTADQVADAIAAKLNDGFVTNAKVSVEVLNYRPFYILGEVTHPGVFPYASGLTLQQAVATAGGFTYRANRRDMFLTRAGQKTELTVKITGQPVYILPGDTIRVGERYF
jgi:polysaccharide export outer membrane protein